MKNSANQFKQLQANAQKIFDGLDPASAIGKSLNKVFNQLSSKVSDLDLITSQSIFSASDLKKSFTLMRDIDKLMLSLQKSAETTSATGLGIDTEALRQAKKELQDLYAEIAAQKRQSVGTLTKGDKRFDELANTEDQTGFDASKSFEQNIKVPSIAKRVSSNILFRVPAFRLFCVDKLIMLTVGNICSIDARHH